MSFDEYLKGVKISCGMNERFMRALTCNATAVLRPGSRNTDRDRAFWAHGVHHRLQHEVHVILGRRNVWKKAFRYANNGQFRKLSHRELLISIHRIGKILRRFPPVGDRILGP